MDFLKQEELEKKQAPLKETKAEKLLRLEAMIKEGLYEPDAEDIAEALINKLLSNEQKTTKK